MLDDFCSVENEKTKNEGTSSKKEAFSFAYDFIYLPIDFRYVIELILHFHKSCFSVKKILMKFLNVASSKRGRGFAFVNFTNGGAVWKFFDAFHQASWPFIQRQEWPKRIEIVCAKLQVKTTSYMYVDIFIH